MGNVSWLRRRYRFFFFFFCTHVSLIWPNNTRWEKSRNFCYLRACVRVCMCERARVPMCMFERARACLLRACLCVRVWRDESVKKCGPKTVMATWLGQNAFNSWYEYVQRAQQQPPPPLASPTPPTRPPAHPPQSGEVQCPCSEAGVQWRWPRLGQVVGIKAHTRSRHTRPTLEYYLCRDTVPNSKRWFTTSFLQPLPYLVTP